MKEFMKDFKTMLPFYLVIAFYCIVHFIIHGWYPVFTLLLAPFIGFALVTYIKKRIKSRKQF